MTEIKIKKKTYTANFSFGIGFSKLNDEQKVDARTRIMEALAIKHIYTFRDRLNGVTEPKKSAVEAIELIFKSHQVTTVWGFTETQKRKYDVTASN